MLTNMYVNSMSRQLERNRGNVSVILGRIANSECKPTVFVHGLMSFRVTSGCDIQRSSIRQTGLLVSGDPGRQGTLVYVVDVQK